MKQLFRGVGEHLPPILKLDSTFLAGLVASSFALPLPDRERWLLIIITAVLAHRDWAAISQARKGQAQARAMR